MGSGLGVRVTMIAVGRGVGVCSGVAVSLAALCSEVDVGAGAGLASPQAEPLEAQALAPIYPMESSPRKVPPQARPPLAP